MPGHEQDEAEKNMPSFPGLKALGHARPRTPQTVRQIFVKCHLIIYINMEEVIFLVPLPVFCWWMGEREGWDRVCLFLQTRANGRKDKCGCKMQTRREKTT